MPFAIFAAPVTYQFDGPKDTICIVADYDLDPQVPSPDSGDWGNYDRDTSWQTEADGIINFDARYTRNFSVELEGVQGVGGENLYYSHYDYPNSSMNTYDASLVFHFVKGDRDLFFTTYASLLEDYAGAGAPLPFGYGKGVREQTSGLTLVRSYQGVEDTARHWFVLSKITNGIATCPGKEKAWKFSSEGTGEPPACEERPRPGHRRSHKHWYGRR